MGPRTGSGHEIRAIWAIVGVLDDGDDGIAAVKSPPWVNPPVIAPLIASDPVRLEWIKEEGRKFARENGRTVRLVRFAQRDDLETFYPDGRPPEGA